MTKPSTYKRHASISNDRQHSRIISVQYGYAGQVASRSHNQVESTNEQKLLRFSFLGLLRSLTWDFENTVCHVRATFFSERFTNVWNSLPKDVDFSSLLRFNHSIQRLDFSSKYEVFFKFPLFMCNALVSCIIKATVSAPSEPCMSCWSGVYYTIHLRLC